MKISIVTFLLFACQLSLCRSTRQRISDYVKLGQQFFVLDEKVDETLILYEDPDANAISISRIFWFCTPEHAPDTNGDGVFDSVVAHALTFRPDGELEEARKEGATLSGSLTPHGYVVAWTKAGSYDETLVDYDDTSFHKFIEMDGNLTSIVGYESSPPGGTGGFVLSGAGAWVMNATADPRLAQLADAVGEELTGEACAKTYAEVWKERNANKEDSASWMKHPFGFFSTLVTFILYFILS